MKKMKLSSKAVLSLILSAVLFCMPAVGFAMNDNYNVEVHAEDSTEAENTETTVEEETETEQETEESSTEDGTVSGNEVKEPVCTCENKCGAYEYDRNCEVCVEDYKLCAYKKPNVTININKPEICQKFIRHQILITKTRLMRVMKIPQNSSRKVQSQPIREVPQEP